MKSATQSVQKLVLPPLLRKGLEAVRVDNGKNRKYVIKSIWKNKTFEYEPWQFFILEVLPSCDDYSKLASVFEDRFGHTITESDVNELLSRTVENELFGKEATSHPMLSSFKELDENLLIGKINPNEPVEKEDSVETSESSPAKSMAKGLNNFGSSDSSFNKPAIVVSENVRPQNDSLVNGDTIVDDDVDNQGHLLRAMQKARRNEMADSVETRVDAETPPLVTVQKTTRQTLPQPEAPPPQAHITASIKDISEPKPKELKPDPTKPAESQKPSVQENVVSEDAVLSTKGFKLFDPGWLIRIIQPLLHPLRHTIYLLPLLLIAALFTMANNTAELAVDFKQLIFNTPFIKHALISMVTVNLSVTLVTAVIAYSYRATVSAFCIVFYMFFFPRFMVRIEDTQQLMRRERIWLNTAPLLLRLGFFSIGILLWFNARTSYGTLSSLSMTIALAGAVSFLITVNPLIKSSGYHILTAFINEPNLREKSIQVFLSKFRGKVYKTSDNNILIAYSLVSTLYTLVVTVAILYIFNNYLQIQLGTVSVLLISMIAALMIWRTVKNFIQLEKAYQRSVQFERWRNRTLPQEEEEETVEKEPPKAIYVYLRRSILVLFLAAMFLPYNYEPGGNFIVLPNEQQTIATDIAGVIDKIDYDGGEILKKGTVIGQLSYSDYTAQLRIYNAKIAQQQAVLDDLKSRPRAEEVQLAKTALETQRTQTDFSKAKAVRLQDYYKEGIVSLEDFEDARRTYQVDLNQIQEKLANLELVKRGATPEELAEAEAKLQSFLEERDYYQEKIEQSVFRMPFDGKLITMHLKQKVGSYLNKGEPLAVAEQTDKVKVEIEVPESDIGYVKENSEVRCRFQVYNDENFYGIVTSIDSNVTEQSYGKIVKVGTVLENKDERLKSGMTGYAKIKSEKMPLWKVLSLALIRFVQVEVWSWLP